MTEFCVFSRKSGKLFKEKSPKALTEAVILSYNIGMEKKRMKNKDIIRWIFRIVTTLACVLMIAFIFSNSLQTGEESSAKSSTVVDTVQKVVAVIAPESPIATATGEAYDKLHAGIRTIAHFLEFALLGALFCWCWYSYTDKKIFLLAPAGGIILVPIIDELLQTLSSGRAAQLLDVGIDMAGGVVGAFFALCTLTIGISIYRKQIKKRKTERASAQSVTE